MFHLSIMFLDNFNIVNRGEWLLNPANFKGQKKDAKTFVGWSTAEHNHFLGHTLCMIT